MTNQILLLADKFTSTVNITSTCIRGCNILWKYENPTQTIKGYYYFTIFITENSVDMAQSTDSNGVVNSLTIHRLK